MGTFITRPCRPLREIVGDLFLCEIKKPRGEENAALGEIKGRKK